MNRFLKTMQLDVTLQWRNNLYYIGLFVGVLLAVTLGWLVRPDDLFLYVPSLLLLVVGGSTLLYVAALIIFEKDEGTLSMIVVSPLTHSQYLWSKIITLTALATLESVVMLGGAMVIMRFSDVVTLPNIPLLLAGIVGICILYTLMGIVMIVRYDKITDFLVPMAAVAVILQLPFLYFLGWVELPLFLLIPTSAPTMIMQGAYEPLAMWEWVYGVGYTAALIVGLAVWAHRAFERHVVYRVG